MEGARLLPRQDAFLIRALPLYYHLVHDVAFGIGIFFTKQLENSLDYCVLDERPQT